MPKWTEEQLLAINSEGENIIVSAGAGSGKTAVLTNRVIRKLKEGININELLILTFTKAAAHEMKERIRREIKKDDSLKKQLDLIDSAFITTFDSYALSIVKKYHYLLNVSPDISIADSSFINIEKEKIINNIFNNLYETNNSLFLKLIDNLCIKDDSDIKQYILGIDEKLNLKIDKREYIINYFDNYFSDKKINDDILKYVSLIKQKIDELKQIMYELETLCDSSYYASLEDTIKPLLTSETYIEIKKNIDLKLPILPRNSAEEIKGKKQELSDLIKEIKQLCEYEDENDIKDKILLTKDYITIILEIIDKLQIEIDKVKYKNNLFEFNDIVKMSINVIKGNKNVKQELKQSLNEIMIDEYQDTNDLQEYFISLIESNNVYMVGDIKQSIYRFRNANPRIFKNKYNRYSKKDNGIKIDLNKNFRSRKEVLDNINLLFCKLMDTNLGGADYKESHQMVFGNSLYEYDKKKQNYNLEILYYDYDNNSKYYKEEIEFFKVCYDIKSKIDNDYQIFDNKTNSYRKALYSDFVILMDRASSFSLAKKIFEYMKIPLTIYKDDTITDSYDLIVIKNIISLIIKDSKKDYDEEYKYLFMSLARSFIFEYSDELIFRTIKNNEIKEDLIIKKIKNIGNNIDNLSLTSILDKIIKEFDFYENLIKLGNINESLVRLEYLNDLAKSLQNIGYTIYDFGDYLKEVCDKGYEIKISADKSIDNNSVKIMTIHKSKGLEFPICYYLGLYKSFNLREIKEKFVYSENYGIVAPYFQNGIGKNIYLELLKNEYINEEISEKIRVFYVALTRAKEQMIMIIPSSKKISKPFLPEMKYKYRRFSDFIHSLNEYLTPFISHFDLQYPLITKEYNLVKYENYKDNLKERSDTITFKQINIPLNEIKQTKFSKSINEIISKNVQHNIDLGKRFHEILEYIDLKKPDLDSINDSFLRQKVKSFLNNSFLKKIKGAKIYKESEFKYCENNHEYHGVIDLIIEYDHYIDIIDFKLKNIFDENYQNQLYGYQRYIYKMKQKTVNIYLYSILDERFIKIESKEKNICYN